MIIIVLMAALFFLVVEYSYSADAPHNDSAVIACADCHPNGTNDPVSDDVCLSCHTNATGGGYTRNSAPRMLTHSSANAGDTYGDWTTACTACHKGHVQDQQVAYGSAAYLATGTISSVSDNGDGTITIGYEGLVERLPGWADPGKWIAKSGNERGVVLFTNIQGGGASFEVTAATGADMTVKGPVSALPAGAVAVGNSFALVYGQLIRSAAATEAGAKSVRFFQNSSAGSFANRDASPGSADPSPDGICQVCHTRTSFWRADGTQADHYSETNCTGCHRHQSGFNTSCDICHSAPPVVGSHTRHAGSLTPRYGSTKVASTSSVYAFGCGTCHGGTHLNTSADPRSVEVVFSGIAAQDGATAAAYAPSASPVVDDPGRGYTFSYSDGACSNTYCHGNFPGSGKKAAVNFSTGSAACGSCHGATNAVIPASGSHSQHASSTRYNFSCSLCHNGEVSGGAVANKQLHANGRVDWAFDPADPRVAASSQYSIPSGTAMPSDGVSRGYGTCSTVYCHSNVQPDGGVGGPSRYATPKWGDRYAAVCGTCHDGGHGAPQEIASGSHPKHLEYQFLTTLDRYKCTVCHKMNPAGSLTSCSGCHAMGTLPPFSMHPNSKVDINFDSLFGGSYNGTPEPGDGYSSCKNSYCHSDGTWVATYTTSTNTSPLWGSGSLVCSGCHGNPPGYAQGSPKRNSHPEHSSETCNACHVTTTSNGTTITSKTLHVNRMYDVSPDTGKGISFSYSFSRSGGTCTNISCHGGAEAQWGVTQIETCQGCHGGTADADDFAGTFYRNGIVSKLQNTGEWNMTGHGRPAASGNYASGNPAADFTTADACLYCHDDAVTHKTTANAFRLKNITNATWGLNGVCQSCHADGSAGVTAGSTPKNGTAKVGSTHDGAKHTAGANGGQFCWDCHDPHGDGNIFMIQAAVAKTSDSQTGVPASTVATSFVSNATGTGYAASAAPFTGICNVCHTGTMHYTATSGDGHNADTRCTQCHKHTAKTATDGFAGGDCITCHSVSQGKRVAAAGQFALNSHHVQGVVLTNQHCYQCHWEADSDGSVNAAYHGGSSNPGSVVNLVTYGARTARPTEYTAGATAVEYIANGSRSEIRKINQHCLGCHNNTNNDTRPFGDTKTPRQYAWDETSIETRYTNTGTVTWGKYTSSANAARKDITKALSAHGNAMAGGGGWSASTGIDEIITNLRNGLENVVCFDCHNSHGSSAGGTTTSYQSFDGAFRGGLLKDTTAGKGGYSVSYTPQDASNHKAGAALCFDCHVTLNPEEKPWAYDSTFGAVQQILGFYDTGRFTDGLSGHELRYPYKARPGKRGHFNNASSSLLTSPSRQIGGLCTPCHDPHGVSSTLGQNQAYAVPLLKGTWLTSPYREDVAVNGPSSGTRGSGADPIPFIYTDQKTFGGSTRISENDAKFAGLCLGCHAKTSLTDGTPSNTAWKSLDRIHESVKGWGGNSQHSYPCSKCHLVHVSKLPRLLATNCMNTNHRGRVVSGGEPASGSSGSFPDCHPGSWPDNTWNNVSPW